MNSAIQRVLAPLPAVPSTGVTYIGTSTTTTNEDTTTFSGVSIGTPHPKRVVVLAIQMGVSVAIDSTNFKVNQIQPLRADRSQSTAMSAHHVPVGTTADIVLTHVGSARKACSVFVIYPESPTVRFVGNSNANTTTDANVANVSAMNKGCLIYAGSQLATLGTFTTTWGGTDAVTESVDAQLESATSYTAGYINFTISSDTNALNMAESTSGTKHLLLYTFPPAYRNR